MQEIRLIRLRLAPRVHGKSQFALPSFSKEVEPFAESCTATDARKRVGCGRTQRHVKPRTDAELVHIAARHNELSRACPNTRALGWVRQLEHAVAQRRSHRRQARPRPLPILSSLKSSFLHGCFASKGGDAAVRVAMPMRRIDTRPSAHSRAREMGPECQETKSGTEAARVHQNAGLPGYIFRAVFALMH